MEERIWCFEEDNETVFNHHIIGLHQQKSNLQTNEHSSELVWFNKSKPAKGLLYNTNRK